MSCFRLVCKNSVMLCLAIALQATKPSFVLARSDIIMHALDRCSHVLSTSTPSRQRLTSIHRHDMITRKKDQHASAKINSTISIR